MGEKIASISGVRDRLMLYCSIPALLAAASGSAFAQCVPDPSTGADINCDGIDTDGLVISASATVTTVLAGAQVLGNANVGILYDMPKSAVSTGQTRNGTLQVDGRIESVDGAAVQLLSGVADRNGPNAGSHVYLTVGSDGVLTGQTGILLDQSGTNPAGTAKMALDNAGTIVGTSGIALRSGSDSRTGFASIRNRADGTMGAILGDVVVLDNAGRIDGASNSAIDRARSGSFPQRDDRWTNSGTITSSNSSATMAGGFSVLTNSGTISNSGTGTAITLDDPDYLMTLSLDNLATGVISTEGDVAIRVQQSLQLTNAGVIRGDVITTRDSAFAKNFVDSTAGTIEGDLIFRGSSDTLVARLETDGGLFTGVTGRIDGGDGRDLVVVDVPQSVAINSLTLPTNFEAYQLAPRSGVTLTLDTGFSASQALDLAGAGTVANLANLNFADQVMAVAEGAAVRFHNLGTLRNAAPASAAQSGWAISLMPTSSFVNDGLIDIVGDGLAIGSADFVNNGTITTTGVAASFHGGLFQNKGIIRSNGPMAVRQYGDRTSWVNEGLIEGTQIGVLMRGEGSLTNRASGTINGGTNAIQTDGGFITNEGVINGNVVFGESYQSSQFVASRGSMLNGDLMLDRQGTLVTYLYDGSGPLAGINGHVNGNGGQLNYRVTTNTSGSIDSIDGFGRVLYSLYDDAALTLTSSGAIDWLVQFTGNGHVDLNADLRARAQPIIQVYQYLDSYELSLVSRGTLTLDRARGEGSASSIVLLDQNVDFTNAGVMTIRNSLPSNDGRGTAIMGGNMITNAGTINVVNSTAVQGLNGAFVNSGTINLTDARLSDSFSAIFNSGTIQQVGGIGPSTGVLARSVTNSGTISLASTAVVMGYDGTLNNSGTIISAGEPAVTGESDSVITNRAGGVISGFGDAIILQYGGTVRNAGTINGNMLFRSRGLYIADGGQVNGDVRFGGDGNVFLQLADDTGVTGIIDGGNGRDMFGRIFQSSATVDLAATRGINFEIDYFQVRGADTVVTLTGNAVPGRDIQFEGEGTIINEGQISDLLRTAFFFGLPDDLSSTRNLSTFINRGTMNGFFGGVRQFINDGTITGSASMPYGINTGWNGGEMLFENHGQISGWEGRRAVNLTGSDLSRLSIVNSGTIVDGMYVGSSFGFGGTGSIRNEGTIRSGAGGGFALEIAAEGIWAVDNSGKIENEGAGGFALGVLSYAQVGPFAVTITNDGTVRANGGGAFWEGGALSPAVALALVGNGALTSTLANRQDGVIEATGANSVAILALGVALRIDNEGTITGTAGTQLPESQRLYGAQQSNFLAGAIQGSGTFNDRIDNSGTITGSIDLGDGNDVIVNRGTITGDIFLGLGDDSFTQWASALLTGTVDAGAGDDLFTVDATGGGAVNGDQFINFERFAQIGSGSVAYSGSFTFNRIEVDGGTVTVAQGQTLTSAGPVTIQGSEGSETVINDGVIAGGIDLGGGSDSIDNGGSIGGAVLLGDGDDHFVSRGSAAVAGQVDGGAGTDRYTLILDADREGIGQDTGFELLDVFGQGRLTLSLAQDYLTIALSSTGLVLDGTGFEVGQILGGDMADALTIADGAVIGRVALGGGNDHIANGGAITGDLYAGQGSDEVFNTGTIGGDVHLDGMSATQPADASSARQLAAAMMLLSEAGPTDGDDVFVNSGTVAGNVFAGGGNDRFTLSGSVGGQIDMGSGDDELILESGWTIGGMASGGEGADIVRARFSGTGDSPQIVDLTRFETFEQLQVQSGTAAIDGTASFGTIHIDGGRLIGRAHSTILGNVDVAEAATFGSAGTVNGNVTVNGTLSPGASPGTMTVNGNLALNAGSNMLFEFTPTISDALVINGSLTIRDGARLTMTGDRPFAPGAYKLVQASGGITGTFGTNVTRDNSVLGVLTYSQNAIELLSMFQLRSGADPQLVRTKDYLNALLLGGQARPGILSAFPQIVGADGYANPAVLSTLSPEAFASAAQIGVENGLAISRALRTVSLAGLGDEGGLFVFGQTYGNWREFSATGNGVARADISSGGYLGGLGYGNSTLGAALFVGRSDSRQRLRGISADNDAGGLFFGGRVHYAAGGLSAGATLLFDRANADTQRALTTGGTARSRYTLRGTTFDGWLGYGFEVGEAWRLGPQVGITHVRVKRGGIAESGGGAFALDVAEQSYKATFMTGDLKLEAPGLATLRPWAAAGIRHLLEGDAITATGGFAGTHANYAVAGAERKKTLPHLGAGVDVAVSASLSLFLSGDAELSGVNGEQHVNGGIRLKF